MQQSSTNDPERDNTLRKALAGRRIVVTRPGMQGENFIDRLRELGAEAVHIPVISIAPPEDVAALDSALRNLAAFDWIAFASANAVKAVAERMSAIGISAKAPLPKIAVIGAATATAALSVGWNIAFTPSGSSGAALAAEFPIEAGERVLLPRAAEGLPALAAGLTIRQALVTEVVAYRTVPHPDTEHSFARVASTGVDALTFTSPSTVVHFMLAAGFAGWDAVAVQKRTGMQVVCIGNTTAAAVRQLKLEPDGIAVEQSQEGLIDVLATCLGSHPKLPSAHARTTNHE